jgi:mRNA interferase RelE/StbE
VAKFTVDIKASAQKELDGLDNALFARMDRKIISLADNPRPAGCKKLRGYKDQWRIRVGNYRIVYLLDDANALVTIMRLAHRKDVYQS